MKTTKTDGSGPRHRERGVEDLGEKERAQANKYEYSPRVYIIHTI